MTPLSPLPPLPPLPLLPLLPLLNGRLLPPAHAHQTEISGDIGATVHIEPNDIPRAGVESLTWFALTRRGGDTVPLDACDCALGVYALPDNALVDSPVLDSVSAEGYENIPGAKVTFPDIGAYELVLLGTPKTEGDFQPFEFRFEVTVATGAPQTAPQTRDDAPISASNVGDQNSGESDSGNQNLPNPTASADDGEPSPSNRVEPLTEQETGANAPAESTADPGAIAPSLNLGVSLGVVLGVLVIGGALWGLGRMGRT